MAIGIIAMPILTGLGNAISPYWGVTLPFMSFMFFMIAAAIIVRRVGKLHFHNKALTTDTGDADTC